MKAREGSQRFSDSKKRLAPGEVLRKLSRRRGVVCEKLSRRLHEFGKKLLGIQRVNIAIAIAIVPRVVDLDTEYNDYRCFIVDKTCRVHQMP